MGKPKKDKGSGDSGGVALLASGRTAFQKESYEDAVTAFTKGLEDQPGKEIQTALLAARLEALIRLGRHASALVDALEVEKLDPGNPETTLRQGSCEDVLGLHSRAVASLEKCGLPQAKEALLTAQRHKREQAAGEYDWAELYKSETESNGVLPKPSNVTSFCSCLEVQIVPGRGRSLVLTADVHEGALLFVSKAFALSAETELQKMVLKTLSTCPQVDYDRFFCLFDGKNGGNAVPVALNLEGRASDFAPGENATARVVDVVRLKQILKFNTFARDTLNEYGAADASPVCGIWFLPTFLNHSCCPNVQRTFVADLMVCRAARHLKAGTELCDTYVSALQPVHIRRERLKADCSFECQCPRCVLEESIFSTDSAKPILDRLDKIVEDIDPANLQKAAKAFDALAASVEEQVSKAISTSKKKLESDSPLKKAHAELFSDGRETQRLASLLCGSFLPVFKGAAFVRKQLDEPSLCAKGYGRCLELLEEVSRSSAYHAHWAAQCALQAFKALNAGTGTGKDEVNKVVEGARRWNTNCYGSDVFRQLMEAQGWPKELLEIADGLPDISAAAEGVFDPPTRLVAESGKSTALAPPSSDAEAEASWEHSTVESDGCLIVSVSLPDEVEPTDLELDVAEKRVQASYVGADGKPVRLTIELSKAVDTEQAPPAKYKKKGGRRLVLELPLKM